MSRKAEPAARFLEDVLVDKAGYQVRAGDRLCSPKCTVPTVSNPIFAMPLVFCTVTPSTPN